VTSDDHASTSRRRASTSQDDPRTARVLEDLEAFATTARRIVARGREAYVDPADDILRRAGRSVIVDVSAAADRLPESFRAQFPDIPWREIRATRNVVAHECDGVRDDLIWETLRVHVPSLVARLTGEGLAGPPS